MGTVKEIQIFKRHRLVKLETAHSGQHQIRWHSHLQEFSKVVSRRECHQSGARPLVLIAVSRDVVKDDADANEQHIWRQ
jgi:hypothetical protein